MMNPLQQRGFTGFELLLGLFIMIVLIIVIAASANRGVRAFALDPGPSESFSYEERVFDNRGSSDVANWNMSIKRETRTEYTFEDSSLAEVTARLNVPVEPLRAEIKTRLEKEQKQVFSRTEIQGESETLEIPVSPRTTRTICIRWKDIWRTGHLTVAVKSQTIDVPFRMFESRQFMGYSAAPCNS
jgi:hypothetical protein